MQASRLVMHRRHLGDSCLGRSNAYLYGLPACTLCQWVQHAATISAWHCLGPNALATDGVMPRYCNAQLQSQHIPTHTLAPTLLPPCRAPQVSLDSGSDSRLSGEALSTTPTCHIYGTFLKGARKSVGHASSLTHPVSGSFISALALSTCSQLDLCSCTLQENLSKAIVTTATPCLYRIEWAPLQPYKHDSCNAALTDSSYNFDKAH